MFGVHMSLSDISGYLMVSAKVSCRGIMCESIPGSPPPFLLSIGVRGEPGNKATPSRCHGEFDLPVSGIPEHYSLWIVASPSKIIQGNTVSPITPDNFASLMVSRRIHTAVKYKLWPVRLGWVDV